jgi:mannose-6-phosphate isomerase-like protein (cupin superfamily)
MENIYKMKEPIIVSGKRSEGEAQSPISAMGESFDVYEWSGSGPDYLHVHYSDDEAWHVLEGKLTFKFSDRVVDAPAGTTVFVPAGVPHSYFEANGSTRYLIILTPKLRDLISALHAAPFREHKEIMRRFDSEIIE